MEVAVGEDVSLLGADILSKFKTTLSYQQAYIILENEEGLIESTVFKKGGKMIGERLSWEKIKELHPNHWVILLDTSDRNGVFGDIESGILHCAVEARKDMIHYIPAGGFTDNNAIVHTKRRV